MDNVTALSIYWILRREGRDHIAAYLYMMEQYHHSLSEQEIRDGCTKGRAIYAIHIGEASLADYDFD